MTLTDSQKNTLAQILLARADDELITGHRLSQWCGHAPILEEDIAFANLALDEIGHAQFWYQLHARLVGEDPKTYPDKLVYFRAAYEYRAAHVVALPNGDWAFSMLRQYLFDALEAERLVADTQSSYAPLAEVAAKIRSEELYHLRHTEAWVKRLGLGTDESNRRMQVALDQIWSYADQWFAPLAGEDDLVGAGVLIVGRDLRTKWHASVVPFLEAANLAIPEDKPRTLSRELQSQHLIDILAELQQVARMDAGAVW